MDYEITLLCSLCESPLEFRDDDGDGTYYVDMCEECKTRLLLSLQGPDPFDILFIKPDKKGEKPHVK